MDVDEVAIDPEGGAPADGVEVEDDDFFWFESGSLDGAAKPQAVGYDRFGKGYGDGALPRLGRMVAFWSAG